MKLRLPPSSTQVIDRSRPLTIYYMGNPVKAYVGDTVATALHAAGIKQMATSFKYHRPRGIMELGVHATDPLMEVDGRFNTRVARTPVVEGMRVEPQFKKGIDIFKLADKASKALQVGFYYKNPLFYKSEKTWDKARKMMRTAPGNLPSITPLKIKPAFDEVNLTPELLVIGGGLGGMEAALVGARSGVRVVLVEAEGWLGGFHAFQGPKALEPVLHLKEQLTKFSNLTVLTWTTASMVYPDGLFVCIQTCAPDDPFLERSYLIRPKVAIFATGAMDRPLMFANNDRPGVMFTQTAQRLVHLYGLKPEEEVLISGGDDQIYKVALDMVEHGVRVVGVADSRAQGGSDELSSSLAQHGVPIWPGEVVIEAKGKGAVTGAIVGKVGATSGHSEKCKAIIASSGRTPLFKLIAQAQAKIVYDPKLGFHLAKDLPKGYATAGRLNGLEDQEAIRAQGRLAAAEVLETIGLETKTDIDEARELLGKAPSIKANPSQSRSTRLNGQRFICFGNDVTEKDVDQALEEGFTNVEMIKRYTTATMGAEQGALSQANFLDYLAYKQPNQMGSQQINTPRPPLAGVCMGVMAAGHHDQPKIPPLHWVQLKAGGKTIRTGPWIRIEHFGDPEEETLAVHRSAGLCDVSTLGKFRIFGPDAERWLNRVNTRSIEGLSDNRICYTAACNEEGVVIDDGIVIKLGDDDYYFTTSTARGPATMEWYYRWKEREWEAWLVNLTEARAGMNLAGPASREILSKLTSTDLSNEALPFMHWTKAELAEVPCYILRMGFLGELSYEIHCPSNQSVYLWEKLIEAGEPLGLKRIGLEAQLICRLEKGHVLPGLDFDGNTNMFEAHLDWLWDSSKEDSIGAPMLRLLAKQPFRCEVIGFKLDGRVNLKDGHLVVNGERQFGYITSVRYSPLLDQTIGLALVQNSEELKKAGEIKLWLEGKEVRANLVKPPFYDPSGERLRI